jgi:hypothetical protein
MALYKDQRHLAHSTDQAFDALHPPGSANMHAGIYRCEGCGREIGIAHLHTMPPQSHHAHTMIQGSIRWRLIVATQNP